MINLFNINNYTIKTSSYSNLLHDKIVTDFEDAIKQYVGAKHAVSFSSATNAIFLTFLGKSTTVTIPSIIPPVVPNAIITSGNKHRFSDDVKWVGDSYILHDFGDYKVVDSAQKLKKNQFIDECSDNDLMIFSFYPTKPVGSCDGGMIVSNDIEKINHLREMAFNGMSYSHNNWERIVKFPGYKMYMNSIQCDIGMRNFNCYEDKLKKLKKIRDKYNKAFSLENTSDHLYRLNVSDRQNFMMKLKEKGIITGIHYSPAHKNPVYYVEGSVCPNSEIEGETTVSIPFHEKMTKDQVSYVINAVLEAR